MDIKRIPLVGGHAALDFVNSVEGRGSETQRDYLGDYERLAHWCARVGLISRSWHANVLHLAEQHPDKLQELRSVLHRIRQRGEVRNGSTDRDK